MNEQRGMQIFIEERFETLTVDVWVRMGDSIWRIGEGWVYVDPKAGVSQLPSLSIPFDVWPALKASIIGEASDATLRILERSLEKESIRVDKLLETVNNNLDAFMKKLVDPSE